MAFGTPQDDIISGRGSHFGLAGNDDLSTTFQNGILDGGTGDDTLLVDFDSDTVPPYPLVQYLLNGGSGDDSISADVRVSDRTTLRDYSPVITVNGGTGNDVTSIDQTIYLDWIDSDGYGAGVLTPSNTVVDQFGDNTVSVSSFYGSDDGGVEAQTSIFTGNGADNVTTDFFSEGNNYSTTINQTIHLGGGNDQLTMTQRSGYGVMMIDAGGGHDNINMTFWGDGANEGGNGFTFALDAGLGNDTVVANVSEAYSCGGISSGGNFNLGGGHDNFILNAGYGNNYDIDLGSGSNVARISIGDDNPVDYGPHTINVVGANGGNDIQIDLSYANDENLSSSVTTGSGRDTVVINNTFNNTVSTGSKADSITVTSIGCENTNNIDAGNGRDTVSVTADDEHSYYTMTSINGGLGDDVITSTHNETGIHNINGGSGHDLITMIGGSGTALGEAGNDTITGTAGDDTIDGGNATDHLTGGLGDDQLTGGIGADTFVFCANCDEGQDTITDWDRALDILNMTGITDAGATGLADDIDAISSITDDGTDVVLSLNSGTVITFAGIGTGAITSVADLVNDPLNQLA